MTTSWLSERLVCALIELQPTSLNTLIRAEI